MIAFRGTEIVAAESEWIGEVPPGWKLSRLKWTVASAKNGIWGDEADGGSDDLLCIRVADFDRERLSIQLSDPTYRKIQPSQRRGRILDQGDLLLEKSGGGEKQPVGAVVTYDLFEPATCSNFVARIEPRRSENPRYLAYLHASLYYRGINERSIKQTTGIQNLDQQLYLDEVVALPPRPVQTAIAEFLDRKTAAIDALIEKKERMIELLDEKRAALVHRAVTKGLDPDVPMKDSGIPWIGEIPAHWKTVQLRRVIQSADYGTSSSLDSCGEVAVLRMNNIQDGRLVLDDLAYLDQVDTELLLAENDLLFNRTNSWALVGKAARVDDIPFPLSFASYLVRLRLDRNYALPSYFSHLLNSPMFLAYARSHAIPSISQANLSASAYKALVIPLPPFDEQVSINQLLDDSNDDFVGLLEALSKAKRRLKEYRQALITQAVTGQLEIPEAA